MFKLIIATLCIVVNGGIVRATEVSANPAMSLSVKPGSSYLSGGYSGGFGGGFGGGQGFLDAGQPGSYESYSYSGAPQGLSHGFGGSQGFGGGHGFSQGSGGYSGGSGQGLGHDHHGGVSIVGGGGDQKGITFDLTKNSGSGHEGTFGGTIVSSHQSGGKSQYSDGGVSGSSSWPKAASEQFQGGYQSLGSSSYSGGVPSGQGYYQQEYPMH